MEENFKVIDNYLMVKMPEEIDHHQSAAISERADMFILHKKINNVVFDFENTVFMDSSGIGIIMGRYKKVSCFGGRVFAVHVNGAIRRIIYLSGLHKVMDILE